MAVGSAPERWDRHLTMTEVLCGVRVCDMIVENCFHTTARVAVDSHAILLPSLEVPRTMGFWGRSGSWGMIRTMIHTHVQEGLEDNDMFGD